ncbi:MAG: hypothetical protein JWO60_1918 [Frankiales bacterium]|nr:hypothetical protein [Frankiales bacterium]
MTRPLSTLDRLRVEKVVWGLDQRIYDLPRRRRVAIRREVRDNLLTAAADVGARTAVRNVGGPAELAAAYIEAQFGGRPRPSWLASAGFLFTAVLVLQSVLTDAANAFADGVLLGNPSFSGTERWGGANFLQTDVSVTFTDQATSLTGGALSPWAYLLLALASAAVGRLWRALPRRAPERQQR